MKKKKMDTKKLTIIAMLCALAVLAVIVFPHIPVLAEYLTYEPKDVVIVMGGLMMGPAASAIISVISSVIEMVTVSKTGPWGLLMNVVSSCAYACTAAAIYKKKRTADGAVASLLCGTAAMALMMLLWNDLVTPIYTGMPRGAVAGMLLPVFLPFNLVKGGLNTGITLLVYKPLITALRKARVLDGMGRAEKASMKLDPAMLALGAVLIVGGVLLVMRFNGIF